jgi:hypothetical protein
VYQRSAPCAKRIRRVSPPEDDPSQPGDSCSTSVTSQPSMASRRASDDPNTPAPTMTALGMP